MLVYGRRLLFPEANEIDDVAEDLGEAVMSRFVQVLEGKVVDSTLLSHVIY